MINNRIEKLRSLMKEKDIFAYIIPSADYHQSEYVGEFFKGREFISGFTGSAGTVVITQEKAILWTDGRYFLQAEEELSTSCVELYKMGQENVPTTFEYIENEVPSGSKVGFDGRTISAAMGAILELNLAKKNITISYEDDLLNEIWEDRPALSDVKAFLLDIKYSGEDFTSKIARVREWMRENNTTTHILTSLDDIAWLFNIRGGDIKYNPVVLSYAVITLDKAILFIDENKLNDEIKTSFGEEVVEIKNYFEIYEFVKTINKEEIVLIDSNKISYSILKNIPAGVKVVNGMNPSTKFKAQKNSVEIENTKKANIRDGVAVTKFMYWLKNNIGKIEITELSAADKITELRREQGKFIEESFGTIAGYASNGAIIHYSVTKESNITLKDRGLFLLDSGGQYFDGTTDITRTFALGELTEEEFENNKYLIKDEVRIKRAKHAVYENQRTLKAVKALEENDIEAFGKLMIESHNSLRDDYEVTGKELDTLVDLSLKHEATVGSRMTGAGFGGCTVSIVEGSKVDDFKKFVGENYKKIIGYDADFYVASIGDGTREI